MKILFVCMGNICRSPTAEGIFRQLVRESGLAERFEIDSCGTGGWHSGEEPDARSQACALEFGIDISDLRARQFTVYDFERFDLILAMDESNYRDIVRLAQSPEEKNKVKKIMSFAKKKVTGDNVPDPYGGGSDGFRKVFYMLEDACRELLSHILNQK